jgi:catechol 2,3-dioxygenase-like lactoylglutathione lyase family enzyme
MVSSRYTHVTIQADDLAESVDFYASVFGMERLPTPDFAEPIQWLRCGDLQLHLIETDAGPPPINHHGLHVDDFEAVYRALREHDRAEFEVLAHTGEGVVDGHPPVYVLPTGTVQLYVRDPAGNLVEVNAPEAEALDDSVVTNLVERADVDPPEPGSPAPVLYGDGLLAAIDGGAE